MRFVFLCGVFFRKLFAPKKSEPANYLEIYDETQTNLDIKSPSMPDLNQNFNTPMSVELPSMKFDKNPFSGFRLLYAVIQTG